LPLLLMLVYHLASKSASLGLVYHPRR
jgi:hypothetical protein